MSPNRERPLRGVHGFVELLFGDSGTWAKTFPVAGLITPTIFLPLTAFPAIVMVKSATGLLQIRVILEWI
jgi:hypothetical protein